MLVTGVWAVLAALAGAAGADEGPPPDAVPTSASAPVDPSSDVLVVDGEDAEPAPTDAAPPGPPEATPDVPAPVAAETPPPDPQNSAAPVDEPVPPVDPSTAEPSALEHTPAGTDAVPVGTDAVPVGADVACLPTLDPTAVQVGTEETAAPAGVPDAVPGPCGGSDAPVPLVDDAAADEGPGTCEDSCAPPSALGPPAEPQPDNALPVVSGVDELTPSAGRTAPAAPAAAARTPAPALPTPALPAPDQPTSPIRPPAAPPVSPPVPGHGTAGGCASSVSAGGLHDGSSTVAIVDLDTVASTPSGSGRSGSGCMADVARRAIDPGSRPT